MGAGSRSTAHDHDIAEDEARDKHLKEVLRRCGVLGYVRRIVSFGETS